MSEYIVSLDDVSEYGKRMIIGNGIPNKELIRCKDCKHASDMINDGRCWCTQLNAYMYYCDMGERKEE